MAYQRNQAAIEMLMPHSKDMEAHKQNYYALRSEIGARVTSMEAMSNSFVYEAPFSQIRHQAQFNRYLPTSPLTARPLQPPDPPDFPNFNGIGLSEWLNICEQIFYLHKIAPEQRTSLASHHMEGKALLWNREFMRCHYGRFPLWTDYIIALGAKFYEPYVKPMKSQCLFPSVTLIKSPPPTTPPEPPIIKPSNKFSAIKAPDTCNALLLPNLLDSFADKIKLSDAKGMVKTDMIQHGESSLDRVSSPILHKVEEFLYLHKYEQDEDNLDNSEKHVDESELNESSYVLNIRTVINKIEDEDNKKNQTSKDENGNNQDINKVTSHVPALENEEEKVFHILQEETMEPKSKIGEKMGLDKTVYLAKQRCSSNLHGKLSTWLYEHEESNMILQHWELKQRNVIHALGKLLPDFLLDSQHQHHLALRHVLYLKSLVDCGIWGFASDEMVNKVCQRLATGLETTSSEAMFHMTLVVALAKHSHLIAEEYTKLLMNPCRRILEFGVVKGEYEKRVLATPPWEEHCQSKRLTAKRTKSWHFKFKIKLMNAVWRLLDGIGVHHQRLDAKVEKQSWECKKKMSLFINQNSEAQGIPLLKVLRDFCMDINWDKLEWFLRHGCNETMKEDVRLKVDLIYETHRNRDGEILALFYAAGFDLFHSPRPPEVSCTQYHIHAEGHKGYCVPLLFSIKSIVHKRVSDCSKEDVDAQHKDFDSKVAAFEYLQVLISDPEQVENNRLQSYSVLVLDEFHCLEIKRFPWFKKLQEMNYFRLKLSYAAVWDAKCKRNKENRTDTAAIIWEITHNIDYVFGIIRHMLLGVRKKSKVYEDDPWLLTWFDLKDKMLSLAGCWLMTTFNILGSFSATVIYAMIMQPLLKSFGQIKLSHVIGFQRKDTFSTLLTLVDYFMVIQYSDGDFMKIRVVGLHSTPLGPLYGSLPRPPEYMNLKKGALNVHP